MSRARDAAAVFAGAAFTGVLLVVGYRYGGNPLLNWLVHRRRR